MHARVYTRVCVWINVSVHVLCVPVYARVYACAYPCRPPRRAQGLVVLKTGSDAFLWLPGFGVIPSFGLALSFHTSTVWGMLPPMVWTPGTPSGN